MRTVRLVFVAGWWLAGLLVLHQTLAPTRRTAGGPAPTASDSLPVVEAIRTRCELPAGTVVFVVRESGEGE
jgi:hypothetical protein